MPAPTASWPAPPPDLRGREALRRPGRKTTAALAAAGTAAAAVTARALWWEPRHVRLRRRELMLPGWPEALDGLCVAVLADLHAGGPQTGLEQIEGLVERVNDAAPDLVALLGDYADPGVVLGDRLAPEPVAERLGRLRAPAAAVLGNHDWARWGTRMADALRDAGLTVLENEAVPLPARGSRVWFLGVADERTRSPSLSALEALPDGEPALVLSHDPDVFPHVPARAALTLAGHIHGGQVNLPLLRERVIPSRHGTRYAGGHVEEGGRHLFVSRGVGTSWLPVRFLAPPEIPLLHLRPG